jgi:polyphosphate glucokinase
VKEKTPHPATPEAVADAIERVVGRITEAGHGPGLAAGCGLPGVVKHGRLLTAANIDKSWIDTDAEGLLAERLGRRVLALNDADAAGVAEMAYGVGRGRLGTVILLTVGTGIGTALFIDGRLVPNTELGHLVLNGVDAETIVSGVARERRSLGWKAWAREFNGYIALVEKYFWPDLIVLGGGVSKAIEKFRSELQSRAPVVAAQLLNTAGIVGAARAGAAAATAAGAAVPGRGDGTGQPPEPAVVGSR